MCSKCASNFAAAASRMTTRSLSCAFSPLVLKLAEPVRKHLAVDRVGLQVHVRPASLDPHGVGKIAKLREVVAFARIQNDPDRPLPDVARRPGRRSRPGLSERRRRSRSNVLRRLSPRRRSRRAAPRAKSRISWARSAQGAARTPSTAMRPRTLVSICGQKIQIFAISPGTRRQDNAGGRHGDPRKDTSFPMRLSLHVLFPHATSGAPGDCNP